MVRTVEVAEVRVTGKVVNVGRGKADDGSYVRFMGGGGQFSVFVADLVGGRTPVVAGQELALVVDIEQRGDFTMLRAVEIVDGVGSGPAGKPL